MPLRLRYFGTLMGGFVALVLANAAQGKAPNPGVSLAYQPFPGCPAEAELVRRVRTRVAFLPEPPGPGVRALEVTFLPNAGRMRGRLKLLEADGTATVREVSAVDCDETVDALALVIALTLDPEALSRPPRVEGCPSATAMGGCAPTPTAKPPVPPPKPPPAPPPQPESLGLRLGFGATGLFLSGTAPTPGPGASFYLRGRLDGVGFSPGARLGVMVSPDQTTRGEQGAATFQWVAGSFGLCPVGWSLGAFEFAPCLGVEAGALRAEGAGTLNPRSLTEPWFALTGTVEASLVIAEPLRLDLTLGAAVPTRRDRYLLGQQLVYTLDEVGLRAGIGASLLW